MEPIQSSLTNEVDSIINTLLSLNQMSGKIDYNANQELFQKVGTLAAVTNLFSYKGDHEPVLTGLTKLKNKIIDFSVHFQQANPEEVKILAEKIDEMKNLINSAQTVISKKVIPTYDSTGSSPEGIAIASVYKDLKNTCTKYFAPSDLPPPLPFWLRDDQSDQQQPVFVGTKEKVESFVAEPTAESKKPTTLPPSIRQESESQESEFSVKQQRSSPKVIEIKAPKAYEFPISKDEAKLLASEKEESKEGSLFAGRNLFSLGGILRDYKEKLEEFEEHLEKYVSSKELETVSKSEHDKLSPQASGLRGGARGGPALKATRGGPAPIKSTVKTPDVSDPQKEAAWERYETAKTQRMRSQKKLAELLFPGKEKDFDVNKLKEYQAIFTVKLNEKIKAYGEEIKYLESTKNQPVAKKVETAESIQQRKLQVLIQNLKNLASDIKTVHQAIVRLETESSKLPVLIQKKRTDMDKNEDIDQNEKLKSELGQLTKRQQAIPKEIQEQQAKLNLNKRKLQDALNTQTSDTDALLKLANVEIERLKG